MIYGVYEKSFYPKSKEEVYKHLLDKYWRTEDLNIKEMIKSFFNDSAAQFASFFTKETNLSEAELKELRKIIDEQIEKKKR